MREQRLAAFAMAQVRPRPTVLWRDRKIPRRARPNDRPRPQRGIRAGCAEATAPRARPTVQIERLGRASPARRLHAEVLRLILEMQVRDV